METFSALLAICAGNSPVPGEFPTQRPVTRSFDVSLELCLNKRLRKQSRGWWFETLSCPLWRHRNVHETQEDLYPVGWISIKMQSYQYRNSHCRDKTILRSSYLHIGISYTSKMVSWYWIRALQVSKFNQDTFSKCVFTVCWPLAWNCLSKGLRLWDEFECSKWSLKTHFRQISQWVYTCNLITLRPYDDGYKLLMYISVFCDSIIFVNAYIKCNMVYLLTIRLWWHIGFSCFLVVYLVIKQYTQYFLLSKPSSEMFSYLVELNC